MPVLNEIDYLMCAIESIRQIADIIVATEGCTQASFEHMRKKGVVTSEGLSTDGTTELLQSLDYIEYHPLGVVDRLEYGMFRTFLEYAGEGDYIWLVTGNEIYFEEGAHRMLTAMQKGVSVIYVSNIVLWHNCRHRIVGGLWTGFHERAFRFQRHAKYIYTESHNFVPNGIPLSPSAKIKNPLIFAAYAREEKRVLNKILWQELDYNERDKHLGGYHSVEDYIRRTNAWFTGEYDTVNNVDVVDYNGKLPESFIPRGMMRHAGEEINTGWTFV